MPSPYLLALALLWQLQDPAASSSLPRLGCMSSPTIPQLPHLVTETLPPACVDTKTNPETHSSDLFAPNTKGVPSCSMNPP